jgi:hypothetical protein
MRVSYGATLDEIVEVHLKLYKRTRSARRDRVIASLLAALLVGVVVYSLLLSTLPWLLAGYIALAGAVLTFAQFGRDYQRIIRKKTRKLVAEQLGGEAPVPVTVALLPEGLVVEQLGTQVRFGWERIDRVVDQPAGIELHAGRPGGLVMVRSRAFGSTAERAAFVRLARGYAGRAPTRTPEPPAESGREGEHG